MTGLLPAFQKPVYAQMKEVDADLYESLEKVGFQVPNLPNIKEYCSTVD